MAPHIYTGWGWRTRWQARRFGARTEPGKVWTVQQPPSRSTPPLPAPTPPRRPTFLPAMRLKPVRPEAAFADPRARLLASYLSALADLAAPKTALRMLEDVPRLLVRRGAVGQGLGRDQAVGWQQRQSTACQPVAWPPPLPPARGPPCPPSVALPCPPLQAFQQGIQAALAAQPPDTHVLVLGSGGGLLSLVAAGAGAGSVTAVERSRMLYRMAKQVLESNCSRGGAEGEAAARVSLLDRRLQAVGVAGEAPAPDVLRARQEREAAGAAAAALGTAAAALAEDDGGALLARRASLLVTDLLDHSVLGLGLLPALDYAAERLLAPGAAVVPSRVRVMGALLELRVGQVAKGRDAACVSRSAGCLSHASGARTGAQSATATAQHAQLGVAPPSG